MQSTPSSAASAPSSRGGKDSLKAGGSAFAEKAVTRDPGDLSAKVAQFLFRNGIESEAACTALRRLAPNLQEQVISSDLADRRSASAALLARIDKLHSSGGNNSSSSSSTAPPRQDHSDKGSTNRGESSSATGETRSWITKDAVEAWLKRHGIDEKTSEEMKKLDPKMQQLVMQQKIDNCQNPSFYLMATITLAKSDMLSKRAANQKAAGHSSHQQDSSRRQQQQPQQQQKQQKQQQQRRKPDKEQPKPPDKEPPKHILYNVAPPPPPVRHKAEAEPASKRSRHDGSCESTNSDDEKDFEQRLRKYKVDDVATRAFRELSEELQKQVMDGLILKDRKNPSAYLWTRIREARNGLLRDASKTHAETAPVSGGASTAGHQAEEWKSGTEDWKTHEDWKAPQDWKASEDWTTSSTPNTSTRDSANKSHPDIEGFLRKHRVDGHASKAVRALSADAQRELMELNVRKVRNISAFLFQHAKRLQENETDWYSTGTWHSSQGPADYNDEATQAAPSDAEAAWGAPGTPGLPPYAAPGTPGAWPGPGGTSAPSTPPRDTSGAGLPPPPPVQHPSKRPLDTASKQETQWGRDAQHAQHKKQKQEQQQQQPQQQPPQQQPQQHQPQDPKQAPQKKQKHHAKPAAANGATEPGSIVFSLRRVAGATDLPPVISIRPCDTLLTVGRAVSCDIVLKVPHVSKSHAKLSLQETAGTWMLMLQDTSSNGTWLNGHKLIAQRFMQVEEGDQVAFLPPTLEFEQPTYEVTRGAIQAETREKGGSTTATASAGSNDGDASGAAVLRVKEQEHSPQPPTETRRNTGAGDKSQQPDSHSRDIRTWLRSLGRDVSQYEEVLLATYDDLKQIQDLYANSVEDFFEDVGVESQQHCTLFREALGSLRNVIFT